MAVSNYFSTKSEHDLLARARQREEFHIKHYPEGEKEEIRQIFRGKGFEGDLLESIINTITSKRKRWVDTMLMEELGLRLKPAAPIRAGEATFAAFVATVFIPLVPLFFSGLTPEQTFGSSAAVTSVAFAFVGMAKGRVTEQPIMRSAIETVLVGGCAAVIAYVAGYSLAGMVKDLFQ